MSVVTNIILTFGGDDKEYIETQISNYIHNGRNFALTSIKDNSLPKHWYAGSKNMEAEVFIGAYNHLDLLSFVKHLISIEWENPEWIRLFIKEEEDFAFKTIKLGLENTNEEPFTLDLKDIELRRNS